MQFITSYLSLDLIIFIFFLALNLIIGLRAGMGVKTVRDFAIGKKDFSTGAVTSTIIATWIGGGFMFYTLQNIYSGGFRFVVVLLSGTLCLLVTGQVLATRMGEFLNNLSVAEAMGDMYGKAVQVITAVSGIASGIGYMAIQFKVVAKMLTFLFGFEGSEVTVAAAIIVILYSAFGGLRSVTITDAFQFVTFSIFIPILALIVWNHLKDPSKVMETINTDLFSLKNVIKWDKNSLFSLGLMIYFAVPGLTPSIFQRISIAKDVMQVKKSFTYAAGIYSFVILSVSFIAILLFTDNPRLDASSLVNYMITQYAYPGLKGLIAVGIVAMAMSTADSELNAAAVLVVNDIVKVLRPKWETTIGKLRRFTILIGLCGLVFALYTKDILSLLLTAGSLYMPVVTVPLLLAIFGFRSTSKPVLIGMGAGLLTIAGWHLFLDHLGIDKLIPGMLANLVFFLGSHYLLRQPGGWVGIKDKATLLAARQERKEFWINLLESFKKFNLYQYLEKNLPTHDAIYSFLGVYIMGATYAAFFTIPDAMVVHYQKLYDIAAHSVLICIAGLITYPAWPPTFRAKWFITYAWPLVIGYTLFVVGTQLVLMSEFNGVQVMILFSNLVLAGIFLSPTLTFIVSALGTLIGCLIFILFYGTIPYDGVFNSMKFNSIYILLVLSTFFLLIFRAKKQKDKVEEEKGHLGKSYAGKKKELSQVIRYSQELAREIEENQQLFNENALSYMRQAIYHIKDYVQLEVGSIPIKKLIHDVKALIRSKFFEEEPTLLVQNNIKQTDISADEDKIQQLLLNAIVFIHENNKANKPIQITLEDATLGYTVSHMKNYIKEIGALRIVITIAGTLPPAQKIYTSNRISVDSKLTDEMLAENLRIIDAHYGYAAVDQLDTHVYVIPFQIRDVRGKVMELLREPANPDPEELIHPIAIEVEKELWQKLADTKVDRKIAEKALDTIKRFHAGVKRKSGEPFFTHPINVALILLTYCKDQDAVVAALLHDTVEDTQLSLANIKALFGEQVVFLVEKVTNLEDRLRRLSLGDHENLERLADYGDKRVMYVKLADRMHNMRTISSHKSLDKQKHIAQETISFFVPAAFSLGLTKIAEELKKLSLDVLSKANPKQ